MAVDPDELHQKIMDEIKWIRVDKGMDQSQSSLEW